MTALGPKILKTRNQTVPKVHILHTSSLHDQKVTTVLYFVKLPTWSVSRNVGSFTLSSSHEGGMHHKWHSILHHIRA